MKTALLILIGFVLGYIAKDLTTIEKQIKVNIEKQKVKGKGNTLDSDYSVKVDEKKPRRKLFNRLKKSNLHKN
jgi:hypothetical protein